jgi:hypothetical protein
MRLLDWAGVVSMKRASGCSSTLIVEHGVRGADVEHVPTLGNRGKLDARRHRGQIGA